MNRLRPTKTLILMVVGAVLSISPTVSFAQDETSQLATPTPSDVETINYTVQLGDTLFSIAVLYGVTVESLLEINDIPDADAIAVGQILTIPGKDYKRHHDFVHEVALGETLEIIQARYSTSLDSITQLNSMPLPSPLIVGQEVLISSETPQDAIPDRNNDYHAVNNLVSIAANMGAHQWSIITKDDNNSPDSTCSFIHSSDICALMVYNQESQITTQLHVSFTPEIPVQGESFAMVISTTNSVTVTASSLQQSVTAMRQEEHYVALFAVPALQPLFAPMLTYTYTLASGEQETHSQGYLIRSGEYLSEDITISDEVAESMTAEIIAQERELIYQTFSARSDEKLWKSPFQVPSQGSITSAFGTRRTYNLFPSSSYHAGTDFGVDGGDAVVAPANGVVVLTAPLTVRGNVVIIDHGWGLMSGFWHLAEFLVEDGDVVMEGQPIAVIGNTGLSTGAHLHWEVRLNGIPVNGLQWTGIDNSLP